VLKEMIRALDPNGDALRLVYEELGMLSSYEKQTLTVKSYASLFRVLYNSRYLPPELSEFALQTLADATFADGLRKGVPAEIQVAHKFGVRDVPEEPDVKQLHDCGIVYHPVRPYLICIMTRGPDQRRNADIIGEVSDRVYKQVDKQTGAINQ
jgi:beta-lactamase class A